MKILYEWIENLAYLFLFLSAVVHFVPEDVYGKYIRYFMGLLIMLLLFTPLLRIFHIHEEMDFSFSKYMEEAETASEKWNVYAREKEAEYELQYQEQLQEITDDQEEGDPR
ncbi:MAG: stage III sporulation protein AF [Lachnospiraceae bacterium]|jgi:stage III sporulation protein AF